MSDNIMQKKEIHGLVPLNEDSDQAVLTHRHQLSVITDRQQPDTYSELEYFTQEAWDQYPFASQDDIRWWMDAKYGLFLHWGPCSLIGAEIGWSRGGTRGAEKDGDEVPLSVYDNLYRYFNPQRFSAEKVVGFAKEAGLRYIILITKHHDGFCMWNTRTTDYNIMNTPFGRDVTKELADACAAENVPFGIYFSQRDWYHKDYFTDDHMNYTRYMEEQLRELLTGYGKISVLWFDAWYPSLFKPEHWNALEVNRLAKELHPGIIINNRCSLPGDYDTPEGVIGAYQVNRPWETTTSIHDGWSWNPHVHKSLKSFKKCIDILIGCVVGGGNLIFNVGPRSDGTIEPEITERYLEIGRWLERYGESVYGTRGGPLHSGTWGGYCAKDNVLYIHILYGQNLPCEDGYVLVPLPEGVPVKWANMMSDSMPVIEGALLKIPVCDLDPDDTVLRIEYTDPIPVMKADPRKGTRLD